MNHKELKRFREGWALTQPEAADLLGVKQSAWNYWETGSRKIPAYIVKAISFFERLNKREQEKEIKAVKASKI